MSDAGVPRWVKVAGVITAVIVALFVVLMLVGDHGPGRHSGAAGDFTAAVSTVVTT